MDKNQSDFGGNPDHDPDPEIFKAIFIYYCNSCRQPRIKYANPWQKFKLSKYFLVTFGF